MRNKILSIILSVLLLVPTVFVFSSSKDYNSKIKVKAYADLPVVRIFTENGKNPEDKENYVNCSFEISNCENEEHNFKVTMKENYKFEEDGGGVGVRLRGNTTMRFKKKPYRIKFEKSKSLFGLKKAKSWVLLADYLDTSNIRNYTAMTLGNDVFTNLDFTAHPNHVVLEFNGEYKGVYLLCEQMDEKEGRANVEVDEDELYTNYTKTEFPFLIEMDEYARADNSIDDADRLLVDGYWPIEIKYPEAKDRGTYNQEDIFYDYITEYLQAVKTTLKTHEKVTVRFRDEPVGFEDLVDVQSLIDYNLLNEFMYNADSVWKSSYMHKSVNKVDEEGNIVEYSKLKFGPVWDFDWAICKEYSGKPANKEHKEIANKITVFDRSVIFTDFLKDADNFTLVANRWNEIKDRVKQVSDKLINYKSIIKNPSEFDAVKWYGFGGRKRFNSQYDFVQSFVLERMNYFNELFNLEHSDFLEEADILLS